MVNWIFKHQFLRAVRSVTRFRTLTANIFAGLLGLVVCLNLLIVGLGFGRLLSETVPDRDPVEVINGLLFYFFTADLVLRIFLQKIPTQSIRHYLALPVKRGHLAHSLLIRSFISIFTLVPFLLFLPISLTVIDSAHSLLSAMVWMFTLITVSSASNLVTIYWKFQLIRRPFALFSLPAVLIGFVLLDTGGLVSIKSGLAAALNQVLVNPQLAIIAVIFPVILYFLSYRLLKRNTYLDEVVPDQSYGSSGELKKLRALGPTGEILALEIKMIFRNKRPRTMLLIGLCMPLFGILFYRVFAEETNFYPLPTESEISASQLEEPLGEGNVKITFRVRPDHLPEEAHVYLAGDHPTLGKWHPAGIPLVKQGDGTWERTLRFTQGTKILYKVTLGSWKTQTTAHDGTVPDDFQLLVDRNQIIDITAESWMIPRRDFIVEFNLIYLGILMTGMLMLLYGQLILGWESQNFDALISRNFDFRNYFNAQFIILLATGFLGYLICVPYAYFGIDILAINTAVFLYNIGINSFILLALSTTNRKRVDLLAGAFDFQGKGAGQFLAILPVAIPPVLIFLAFRYLGHSDLGFWALGIAGLVGLLLHRPLLNLVEFLFHRQKYRISTGFREV